MKKSANIIAEPLHPVNREGSLSIQEIATKSHTYFARRDLIPLIYVYQV
jgi:hypothetical protein